MPNFYQRALLACSVAALSLHTHPASAEDTEHPDGHAVDEVIVLSSPFLSRRSDLLTTTHILSEAQVNDHITDTIGDLVDQLPGVDQAPNGSGVGQPLIRGLGGYRIAVLENGLGNGDVFATGGDHANAISLIDQSRVELIKGAGSLRYGPYATTGVINMFSRHANPERGRAGLLALGHASVNSEDYVGLFASETTDRFGVSASGFYSNADNVKIPTHAESSYMLALEGEQAEDTPQRVANSDTHMTSYSAAGHIFGSQAQLSLLTSYFKSGYGIVGHAHSPDEGADASVDEGADEGAVSINMEKQTSRLMIDGDPDHWPVNYHLDLAFTNYNHAEREGGLVATQFGQDTIDMRFEISDIPQPIGEAVMGVSWQDSDFSARGEEAYVPSTERSLYSAYYLWRHDWGQWVGEAGLRWDQQEIARVTPDAAHLQRQYDLANLSVGTGYRLWPNGLVGVSLSRTERAPSAVELFADGVHAAARRVERGSSSLKKEQSAATELFVRHEFDAGALNLALFRMDYSNFIYLNATGNTIEGLPELAYGQSDALVEGYEVSVEHAQKWADISVKNEVTVTALRGTLAGNIPFRAMPADKLTWDVHVGWKNYHAIAGIRMTKDQKRLSPEEIETDGYQALDLSFGWHPVQRPNLTFSLDIRNVTDAEIRYHTSELKDLVPQPGRDVRLALRAAF